MGEAACERRLGSIGVAESEFAAASQPVAERRRRVGRQMASGYRMVAELGEFGVQVESDFVGELPVRLVGVRLASAWSRVVSVFSVLLARVLSLDGSIDGSCDGLGEVGFTPETKWVSPVG